VDKHRKDRILDVAVELAAAGGYENVRQRDVADQAGIALGTLYKSFISKEHILSAAMAREADELDRRLKARPPAGKTPAERLQALFKILTRAMCQKPKLARAVIRATASGQPEVAAQVIAYQGRMNAIIGAVMQGEGAGETDTRQVALATLLQQIWFASLVAWSAGIFNQTNVNDHMNQAIELVLASPKARDLRVVEQR
jgi:AcrR family transcriptional regulator